MNVLRNVHEALAAGGALLDVHPLAYDAAVRVEGRGLGYVDESLFERVLSEMEDGVAAVVAAGLFEEEGLLERDVVERFEDGAELLEFASEWENLRVPAQLRRRLRSVDRPVEMVERLRFRLFRRT